MRMALKLTCPTCAAVFGLAEDVRGKKAFCPKCGQSLTVASTGVASKEPSQSAPARGWNPRWLLLIIPLLFLLFLPCGLAEYLYLAMRGRPDEPEQVAKNDGDQALPPGNTEPEKAADETPEKPAGKATQKPANKATQKPVGSKAPVAPPAKDELADLLKDNYLLPGKARPGKPFTHQFHVKGAHFELWAAGMKGGVPGGYLAAMTKDQHEQWEVQRVNGAELTGLTLTPQGLLTWTPSIGLPERTYYVMVRIIRTNNSKIPSGLVIRTIKIVLEEDPENALALPSLGGWVMHSDGVRLIAALPDQAQLAYIDTVANKELKRVDLSFMPDRLAWQGKRLFASAQGANAVHVLDLDSGVDKKTVKLDGGVVVDLVCHPEKGLVYAAMSNNAIVAIDADAGTAVATGARGRYLAMDPHNAHTLYAAFHVHNTQTTTSQVVVGQRVREDSKGRQSTETIEKNVDSTTDIDKQKLAKFTVMGKALKEIGVNRNLGPNEVQPLRVSSDGKRVGFSGGRLFSADDITSPAGVGVAGASDFAFHPVLNLGAAETDHLIPTPAQQWGLNRGKVLHLVKSNSLAEITAITLSAFPFKEPPQKQAGPLLTFGGWGTKLLYYDRAQGYLRSMPLTLTQQDKRALAKAYPK
jgi:hypothetical protein